MNQYHAKTLKGLENVLVRELEAIGAKDVQPANRGVNFSGSVALLYKANLYLRTALRVLVPVARFSASDEDDLYRKMHAIDWSEFMTYKNSFAIDAVTFSRLFRNNHYVELRARDAIVDQFRERTTIRPSVDTKNADIRINIHIQERYVTVSLDSSGESLHKRGYRKEIHEASLSEVLAAGLVLLTGWSGEAPLYNPMCGSGTIAIEAAMIAADIYPGITGRRYGFQHWRDYDEKLFENILENMPPPKTLKYPVIASDIDGEAVRMTRENARFLQPDIKLDVRQMDFLSSQELPEPGTVILNPPYDERLRVTEIEKIYAGMGSVLKHAFPGSDAWIFSANMEALKHVGLKPEKKYNLFNGRLECRYNHYQLFSGTRKEHIRESTS